MNKHAVFIIDCDDVLVDFSSEMYSYIRSNWRKYSRWFSDLGELTPEEIQARRFFNMTEWLIQKKYTALTSKQYTTLARLIFSDMEKHFFTTDIYHGSVPTKFADSTVRNQAFIESSNVEKVIIISRNITDEQEESKRRFLKKYFDHPKIEYLMVGRDEKKSDALRRYGISSVQCFIDDELVNVNDIATSFDLHEAEIIMPRYGYNQVDPALDLLIRGKGGSLTYYDAN